MPDHVDELRVAGLSLYSVKAESIHISTNEYLRNHEGLAQLLHHRTELREAELLLNQLDWQLGSQTAAAALKGPANLLAELLLTALIGRLEALVDVVTPAEKETGLDLAAVGAESDR